MKINDVLNCVNKTLEEERGAKGLPKVLGHFVYYLNMQHRMGTNWELQGVIDFVNLAVNTPYTVVSVKKVIRCPSSELDVAGESVALETLTSFFNLVRMERTEYEKFVNGEFQGWN